MAVLMVRNSEEQWAAMMVVSKVDPKVGMMALRMANESVGLKVDMMAGMMADQ